MNYDIVQSKHCFPWFIMVHKWFNHTFDANICHSIFIAYQLNNVTHINFYSLIDLLCLVTLVVTSDCDLWLKFTYDCALISLTRTWARMLDSNLIRTWFGWFGEFDSTWFEKLWIRFDSIRLIRFPHCVLYTNASFFYSSVLLVIF